MVKQANASLMPLALQMQCHRLRAMRMELWMASCAPMSRIHKVKNASANAKSSYFSDAVKFFAGENFCLEVEPWPRRGVRAEAGDLFCVLLLASSTL